ncbi:unnamed protein product [Linum trigynum]|uniref:Uncharacterized protein n=1 Tax=Linum trigynum TaxID=586398 RepID=A0AAV2FBZ4_9ROSI
MIGDNEINLNESKVVSLNTRVLISNFKLGYNLRCHPDGGSCNRDLGEFLERKLPANSIPVDDIFSFDRLDRSMRLLNRVYRPQSQLTTQINLEKQLSTTVVVPVIVFYRDGSFTYFYANTVIYDTFCRRIVSLCGSRGNIRRRTPIPKFDITPFSSLDFHLQKALQPRTNFHLRQKPQSPVYFPLGAATQVGELEKTQPVGAKFARFAAATINYFLTCLTGPTTLSFLFGNCNGGLRPRIFATFCDSGMSGDGFFLPRRW